MESVLSDEVWIVSCNDLETPYTPCWNIFSRPKLKEFFCNHPVSRCFSPHHSSDLSLHFVHYQGTIYVE